MNFARQRKASGKDTAYIETIKSKTVDRASGCTGCKAQSTATTTRAHQTAEKADQAAKGATGSDTAITETLTTQ